MVQCSPIGSQNGGFCSGQLTFDKDFTYSQGTMSTFGWSYKTNASGSKRPNQQVRKVEEWQKTRDIPTQALHPQSHSAESLTAGKTDRRLKYDPRAKLYVGNLHWETKEGTLAQYFSTFGEIETLKIIKDHETGTSRGFGFITFTDVDAASEAKKWCAYNHLKIDGRKINVKSAERPTPLKTQEHRNKRKADSRKGPTLYWEYKWSEGNDVEVFGPFETSLMLEWSKAGYFASGCWVRQRDPCALSSLDGDFGDDETTDSCDAKRFKSLLSYSDSSDSEDEDDRGASLTIEDITAKDSTIGDITSDNITSEDITTKDVTTEDITTEDITSEDITSEDITTKDITSEDITTKAVTTNNVATNHLATKVVTTEDLTNMDVTSEDITSEDITSEDITTKDVTTKDVTTKDITSEDITSEDITTKDITSEDITTKGITSEDITSEDITSKDITTNNVTTNHLATKVVTTKDLTNMDVTTEDLTTKDITSEDITTEDGITKDITTEDITTEYVTCVTSKDITSKDVTSKDTYFVHVSEIDFEMFP